MTMITYSILLKICFFRKSIFQVSQLITLKKLKLKHGANVRIHDGFMKDLKELPALILDESVKLLLTNFEKLARDMLKTHEVRCAAVDHGNMYEKTALKKYEEISGHQSTECGLFVCKDYPFLSSSPDGLVDDDKVVEVKCPYAARNSIISSSSVKYLHETVSGFELLTDHDYYYQVQGQMMCTDREVCDLIVFTFEDVKVLKFPRNDDFITEMTKQLELFYNSYFKKALLDKYFYRNYRSYKF